MARIARDERERGATFIRDWRKHRTYTLERLAEALGEIANYPMTDGQLSRIENGRQAYSQDLLEALAIVLQCEPADLIRRRPGDTHSIETDGLAPDQIQLVKGMVEQFRKAG